MDDANVENNSLSFIGWVSFLERWIVLISEVKFHPLSNFDLESFIFNCV